MNETESWEWVWFRVVGADGRRYGSACGNWVIYYHRADRGFHVLCLPTGYEVTAFDLLRHTRRFCEAIDPLADWTLPPAELIAADPRLQLRMHREALQITGGRPVMRVVASVMESA